MVEAKQLLDFIPALQSLAGIKSDTVKLKVSIVSQQLSEVLVYMLLNVQFKPSNIMAVQHIVT